MVFIYLCNMEMKSPLGIFYHLSSLSFCGEHGRRYHCYQFLTLLCIHALCSVTPQFLPLEVEYSSLPHLLMWDLATCFALANKKSRYDPGEGLLCTYGVGIARLSICLRPLLQKEWKVDRADLDQTHGLGPSPTPGSQPAVHDRE